MITRRIVINIITFFVMAALLIALLVVSIFRVKPRYTVDAIFADSGGVFTGQEVTYRGVTVGRIGELKVVDQGVDIELVIEKEFDRIPKDTRARVMFKSAVGEQFVDLLPNSDKAPYLGSGDVIPRDRTDLPVQQEELLRLLNAVLDGVPPDAIGRLVDTLGTGLGTRGPQLHLLLASLDPITAVLARRTAELNRIAVNGDKVGTAFDRSSGDFVRGADSLATVAQALAAGSANLGRVLEEGSQTAPELASLIASRKDQLNTIIADLADVTRISYSRIRSVDATLKWVPLFLGAAVQSFDAGNRWFRFGLVMDQPAPPVCDYNTPRRPSSATGDASYQPHTGNFAGPNATPLNCTTSAGARSSGAAATPPGAAASVPAGPTGALPGGLGRWVNLVTDLLPAR